MHSSCSCKYKLFINLDFSADMSFTNAMPSLYNVTVAAREERKIPRQYFCGMPPKGGFFLYQVGRESKIALHTFTTGETAEAIRPEAA